MQLTYHLANLFSRDLEHLKKELNAYNNEADLWLLKGEILNTAGNLTLHLIGNLNFFIGANLGNTGYVRHRELEFSAKNVPRAKLISDIEATIKMLNTTLAQLTADDLEKPFEVNFFKEKPTTAYWLMHLSTHLNYHLGQINYHRRLINAG